MRRPAPEIANWLAEYNKKLQQLQADGFIATPENTREGLARLTASMTQRIPDVGTIVDSTIGKDTPVPVRIYHPDSTKRLPVLIYCHGGGHMAGSVESYDPICRKLAVDSQHIVISVDYRLAPEHPYPAGLEDAAQVIRHYHEPLEHHEMLFRKALSIAGDSGGGAMAATLAHDFRNNPAVNILKQVLIYPSLDYTMQQASVTDNGKGYFLHQDKMRWLFDNYFQHNENRRNVSPLYMELDGRMPRSLIITAEFCPLRDEGLAYAERLEQAGNTVEKLHFEDMIHAFLNMEKIAPEACHQLYRRIADFLNSD